MISYGRQKAIKEDVAELVRVLHSDFLTQGPEVPRFGQVVAGYCGAEHTVTINFGTSALHVGCMALELGSGDRLWTSPITFVISVHLQPFYREGGFCTGMFPAAEAYYERALSLPLFPTLSEADQDRGVPPLREIL